MNKKIIKIIREVLKKVGIRLKTIAEAKIKLSEKGLVLCMRGAGDNTTCGIVRKEYEDLWYELQKQRSEYGNN